jgi:hypothetical protein
MTITFVHNRTIAVMICASTYFLITTPFWLTANAGAQPLPEAGATEERTL